MSFMNVLEKIFLRIIKIGLWVIPFVPLYVSSSMLFPFITGKNFTFRIIIEIIFALWVGLVVARPEYRPKLTRLFITVSSFIGIVFLADVLSPNVWRAFFANYERMEGFMMIGHLYLYFVMLASVFRAKKDWMVFFYATIAASVIVSYFALLQRLGYRISIQGGFRVDSTIGNPTYLAAYLLFHLWLLLMLIYEQWQVWWLRIVYGFILIFELAITYFTATRGVVLALVMTMIPCAGLVVWRWNTVIAGARISSLRSARPPVSNWTIGRKIALICCALIISIPFFLWSIRHTAFVESSQALHRLTNYSFKEDTIRARSLIWKMSLNGFFERPLFGWGQENYYLVFQKYFEPKLYDQETWFDRSHNVIFDWLVHTGFFGLLSYLAIFAVAVQSVVRGVRIRAIPHWHGIMIGGLFVSYFLQNIFVFDNLNTYLLFFAFLAYSQFLIFRELPADANRAARFRGWPWGIVLSGVLVALASIPLYFWNIKPIEQSRALIEALQIFRSGAPINVFMPAYQRAVAYDSFGTTEVREQITHAARTILADNRFSADEKKQFVEFAIAEIKKETAHPAKDVKHVLFTGAVLDQAISLNPAYGVEAEKSLLEAVRLSPTKQIVYFELGQLYLVTGNPQQAAEALYRAWKLEKSYKSAASNALLTAILAKKLDYRHEIEEVFSIESFGEENVRRFAGAAQQAHDPKTTLEILSILVRMAPQNAEYKAAYAALRAELGQK